MGSESPLDALGITREELADNAAIARKHNQCPWPEAEPIPFGATDVDPKTAVWCGRMRMKMPHGHVGWPNCRANKWDHYDLTGVDTSDTPLIDWAPVTKDVYGGTP